MIVLETGTRFKGH